MAVSCYRNRMVTSVPAYCLHLLRRAETCLDLLKFACFCRFLFVIIIHILVLKTYSRKYRSIAEQVALKRASEFTMVVTAVEVVELRKDILEHQSHFMFAITEESMTTSESSTCGFSDIENASDFDLPPISFDNCR